ncbi:hypothetical protein M409DRAFT_59519 [Zasmidium cellare ATCC 36951]|uniref:Uncharacterized protein n=1 Tax=Zasmidium cellare ATCC 36951 TaxID=1080233 RepID=A0A6A6C1R9_ZASCE|nr:uncharacterized protein M409DRAFT_59519 [Zasmidium cellare ATCC 36951]KAF2160994.1 hypothetical protein M409DRAFT_59519 [Zasmidium cellare ATCC 36951]
MEAASSSSSFKREQSLSRDIKRLSSLVNNQVDELRREGTLPENLARQATILATITDPLMQFIDAGSSKGHPTVEAQQQCKKPEQGFRDGPLESAHLGGKAKDDASHEGYPSPRSSTQTEEGEGMSTSSTPAFAIPRVAAAVPDEHAAKNVEVSSEDSSASDSVPVARGPRVLMPGFTKHYEEVVDLDVEDHAAHDMGAELKKWCETTPLPKRRFDTVSHSLREHEWVLSLVADLPKRPGYADKDGDEDDGHKRGEGSEKGASPAAEGEDATLQVHHDDDAERSGEDAVQQGSHNDDAETPADNQSVHPTEDAIRNSSNESSPRGACPEEVVSPASVALQSSRPPTPSDGPQRFCPFRIANITGKPPQNLRHKQQAQPSPLQTNSPPTRGQDIPWDPRHRLSHQLTPSSTSTTSPRKRPRSPEPGHRPPRRGEKLVCLGCLQTRARCSGETVCRACEAQGCRSRRQSPPSINIRPSMMGDDIPTTDTDCRCPIIPQSAASAGWKKLRGTAAVTIHLFKCLETLTRVKQLEEENKQLRIRLSLSRLPTWPSQSPVAIQASDANISASQDSSSQQSSLGQDISSGREPSSGGPLDSHPHTQGSPDAAATATPSQPVSCALDRRARAQRAEEWHLRFQGLQKQIDEKDSDIQHLKALLAGRPSLRVTSELLAANGIHDIAMPSAPRVQMPPFTRLVENEPVDPSQKYELRKAYDADPVGSQQWGAKGIDLENTNGVLTTIANLPPKPRVFGDILPPQDPRRPYVVVLDSAISTERNPTSLNTPRNKTPSIDTSSPANPATDVRNSNTRTESHDHASKHTSLIASSTQVPSNQARPIPARPTPARPTPARPTQAPSLQAAPTQAPQRQHHPRQLLYVRTAGETAECARLRRRARHAGTSASAASTFSVATATTVSARIATTCIQASRSWGTRCAMWSLDISVRAEEERCKRKGMRESGRKGLFVWQQLICTFQGVNYHGFLTSPSPQTKRVPRARLFPDHLKNNIGQAVVSHPGAPVIQKSVDMNAEYVRDLCASTNPVKNS